MLSGLFGSVIDVLFYESTVSATLSISQASQNLGSGFLVYFRHILIDSRYHDVFQLFSNHNSSGTSIKDNRVHQSSH